MTQQPEMRLVPRYLTSEMMEGGLGMAPTAANLTAQDLTIMWTMMLAAAPQPDPGVGELRDRVQDILLDVCRQYLDVSKGMAGANREHHRNGLLSDGADRLLAALKASEKENG